MIQGVIFDMDGVLLDSEPFICEAAVMMFAEHGVTVSPADFLPFVGAGENRYLGGVAEKYGFAIDIDRDKARTYEIYDDIVKGRLSPLPGAIDFIAGCRSAGLKLAIATSADKRKMLTNLHEINLPPSTFDAVVNGLDVSRRKPHPEIFLTAAQRLGVEGVSCLVVEDAVNGVAAAKAAGARCLAITTSFTPQQLAGADWFAADLAHAPPECIRW
ncbi:MAG: HAD-IA family hydrolase [Planctomycetes bacterium]|nr:HAD-IA family hydrolase [Planctomycetota bacterium]